MDATEQQVEILKQALSIAMAALDAVLEGKQNPQDVAARALGLIEASIGAPV